jgi:membrane fusion protein, multidrug efflux system
MKKEYPRNLARTILIITIAILAVVILFKALGFSITRGASPSAGGSSFPPGAAPAIPQGKTVPVKSAQQADSESRTIAVRAHTITSGSISNYTKIQGDAVAHSEIKIYPKMEGKILEIKVAIGDHVSVGDTIALVDPSEIGKKYMPNPVESTVSGTVLSIPVHEGDTVTTTAVVATVGDILQVKIETHVPEIYISSLRIGTSAEITFDALPNVVFAAKISEINPIVNAESRTIKISLRLNKADSRVLVGMSASVSLVVEHRSGVILAPRDAVTESGDGGAFVYVIKDDNTVERRTVLFGMESESFFEIKKGLTVGEKVVTDGKDSINEGSRVAIVDDETGAAK